MGDSGWQLAVVAVLIVVNAAFAGSEMALVSLREGQLRRLERLGPAGRRVVTLARDPNRFLATIQIGITLAGFLASATAAVSLAEPVVPVLGFLGGAAEPVAIVAVTVVLTFVTLVFGELAPKRIAMQHAERWSLVAARPIAAVAALARPAVWLLSTTSDGIVRLVGGDPDQHREDITPAEVRDLVNTHAGFTTEQRMIIAGAVEITDRVLREVLVPRREVFTLDPDTPVAVAGRELAASGHSRAPVVRERNLDNTVGVVALRDLVAATGGTVAAVAHRALTLPESLRAADALRRFRAEREQFAIVIDEHGSADGIVTMEDLVEEIVGELRDTPPGPDRHRPDGTIVLPGAFPVHDLSDLGVDVRGLRGRDYTTVAGLIIARLGRLPTGPGDTVTIDGWTAEVAAVDHHAITRVRLAPRR